MDLHERLFRYLKVNCNAWMAVLGRFLKRALQLFRWLDVGWEAHNNLEMVDVIRRQTIKKDRQFPLHFVAFEGMSRVSD